MKHRCSAVVNNKLDDCTNVALYYIENSAIDFYVCRDCHPKLRELGDYVFRFIDSRLETML